MPEVLSAGWHLIHGRSVQLGPWDIPVPWECWVIKGKGEVDIQRVERWSLRNNPDSNVIVGNLSLPVGAKFDFAKWKRAEIEDHSDPEYQYAYESTSQVEDEVGVCLTETSAKSSDRLWTHCMFPIHGLDIQYWGSKERSQMVQLIIDNIKPIRE